jgi:WD40 repeat protein
VWDTATGACTRVVSSVPSAVLNLCAADGHLFAAGYNADITVYDPRTYLPHATLSGHKWEVWQLAWTDGVLFSGSFDHTIKRWDLRTLSCTATLRGHKGACGGAGADPAW